MRATHHGLLAVLWLPLALSTGCRPAADASGTAAAQAKGPQPVNVVIFLVDTLRADRLNCYGYRTRETSPNIDALARESVLFEHAYSLAPWTLPSVVSLQTSTYPCEHNVLADGEKIDDRLVPLAERLKQSGYATASWFANPYAGRMSGLGRGYDLVEMQRNGDSTNSAHVEPWLMVLPGKQNFYCYLHNTEPHDPQRTPPSYCEPYGGNVAVEARRAVSQVTRLYRDATKVDYSVGRPLGATDNTDEQRRLLEQLDALFEPYTYLYDASVRHADENVGDVVQMLKRRGVWDDTLFILVADHGEEFGEHGGWQHDQSVYDELVHVPLIIKLPKSLHAGARITETVTLLDVMPTIAAVLNRPEIGQNCRGHNLLPLIEGRASGQDVHGQFVVTAVRHNKKKFYRPWKEQRGDINVAVRFGKWKGIWNKEPGSFELYDLSTDPHETTDLAGTNPSLASSLTQVAQRSYEECLSGAYETSGDLSGASQAEINALRTLGYVGDEDPRETPAASQPAGGGR